MTREKSKNCVQSALSAGNGFESDYAEIMSGRHVEEQKDTMSRPI